MGTSVVWYRDCMGCWAHHWIGLRSEALWVPGSNAPSPPMIDGPSLSLWKDFDDPSKCRLMLRQGKGNWRLQICHKVVQFVWAGKGWARSKDNELASPTNLLHGVWAKQGLHDNERLPGKIAMVTFQNVSSKLQTPTGEAKRVLHWVQWRLRPSRRASSLVTDARCRVRRHITMHDFVGIAGQWMVSRNLNPEPPLFHLNLPRLKTWTWVCGPLAMNLYFHWSYTRDLTLEFKLVELLKIGRRSDVRPDADCRRWPDAVAWINTTMSASKCSSHVGRGRSACDCLPENRLQIQQRKKNLVVQHAAHAF
jgi:hypothetical protein